jgi:hypothetical protein
MATSKLTGIFAAAAIATLCLADRAPAAEPLPNYARSDGAAGIQQYVPGRWGMIAVDLVNPADRPAEVLSALYFPGQPGLQYGRRLWLPAASRRSSWYPVLVPANLPSDKSRAEVKSLLAVQAAGGKDVLSGSRDGQMLHTGMLSVVHERMVTAAVLDDDDAHTHGAIAAMRQSRDLSVLVPTLRDPMPPDAETLDGLDQLVVASDRLVEDAACLIAVRRWLHGGGRMWILLDRVQPATVGQLLGDAMRFHAVDRVGLTQVQFEGSGSGRSEDEQVREFEEPVDLVRVVGPDLAPTHKVNGWPASFWQRAGRGRVLFTTLGARGWIRPRVPGDLKPKNSAQDIPNVATGPLANLASEFMQPRERPPLEPQAFRELVSDQIGYRIVSRQVVSWTLGGFCFALLMAGLVLARVGRLQWLGWIGPALALAVAVSLVLMGRASRTAVPPTAAIAQLVEVTPGVEDVRVTGFMALYHQNEQAGPLGAQRGGIFLPDMAGLGGVARRMVWTDFDRWHWENLALPAGVRTAPLTYATEMGRPIRARASFGPEGLAGSFSAGPFQDVGDAIVAAPMGRSMAVHLDPDGSFTAGPRDMLAAGHYLGETMLSDRQRGRQQIYQRMLQGGKPPKYPDRPMLLAWASPLDMRFLLAEDVRPSGEAVLAVPLEIERPAPGTRVAIPPPFLPYESVAMPGELVGSATFNNLQGKWIGPLTDASRIVLRFQCPKELLPLRPEKALITVKLNAPSRKLEIFGLDGDRPVSLTRFQSPLGTVPWAIDRADLLRLDPEGGLRLGLHVGTFEGQASINATHVGWKIDDVYLEVTAETLKR